MEAVAAVRNCDEPFLIVDHQCYLALILIDGGKTTGAHQNVPCHYICLHSSLPLAASSSLPL